jgi:puromycin-sensitive aminopeptidase
MSHPTQDRNFRLPLDTRPARYRYALSLDVEARTFEGKGTLELSVGRAGTELTLHAAELQLSNVQFEGGGKRLPASEVRYAAESQTVTVCFPEALPKGEGRLSFAWRGQMNAGLRGLYRAGPMAVTQFEAADARRLFPCFDEPSFKARWALTLTYPATLLALANGAPVEERVEGGARTVRFEETELLSSYLVALVCGPLDSSPVQQANGIPVRTWSVPEKVGLTAFGQEVALAVLPRLQDYFGLPYAFGKVDQIAVPDFEAGAMENAGLVTYREIVLLLDPKTASVGIQKRVAEVITHELAHQWFGNWVTMVWWDDLWLNEAFATWMAYKIVDGWRPEWRMWLDFDQGKASALGLDALRSTHPIRSVVRNADEATENFDAITYQKGGAVLRMIEGYLGEERFRAGIRQYMQRHARANAVADDLWGALAQASSEPVVELANAWIGQSGYPLVSAALQGSRATLSQTRYFSEPGQSAEDLWPIPVVLKFRDEAGVKTHRALVREAVATVELPAQGQVRWLCANAESSGFYRVRYDGALLPALAEDLGRLSAAERVSLLSDQRALVRSAHVPVSSLLELASRFGGEQDYAVLDELDGALAAIEYRLVADEDIERFRRHARELTSAQLRPLGLTAQPNEPIGLRLRRAALVRMAALTGRDPSWIAQLREGVDRVLEGDKTALEANLQEAAVLAAARGGDEALFDRLLAAYGTEADPAFKRRYLFALAAFEAPALAKRAAELAFSPTVPTQEFAGFATLLLRNPVAREEFWTSLQARWEEVARRGDGAPMVYRRVVEGLGMLRERRHLEQAQALWAKHPADPVKQAWAQTLERLAQEVAFRERALPQTSQWLTSHAAQGR